MILKFNKFLAAVEVGLHADAQFYQAK